MTNPATAPLFPTVPSLPPLRYERLGSLRRQSVRRDPTAHLRRVDGADRLVGTLIRDALDGGADALQLSHQILVAAIDVMEP